jgi:hypothetical protein
MTQDPKQPIIVRQSQLTFVQNYAKQLNINLSLKETIGIVNVMADYCMNGYSKELAARIDAVDKFIMEKFEE